jgi:hypothetical protein
LISDLFLQELLLQWQINNFFLFNTDFIFQAKKVLRNAQLLFEPLLIGIKVDGLGNSVMAFAPLE